MAKEKVNPVYLKCEKCGESWKICTPPIEIRQFIRVVKNAVCPHCNNAAARTMSLAEPPQEEGVSS